MPYFNNTPESKVSRSDSKNPATTCRGITSSGHPCRRSLASSPNSSPPGKTAGRVNNSQNADIAALYCWQHKDQAQSIPSQPTWKPDPAQNQRRSSIDTLMDRLGVLNINDPQSQKPPYPPKKKQTKRSFCCFDIIEEENDEPAPRPSAPRPPPVPGRPPQQQMNQFSPLPLSTTKPPPRKSTSRWIPSTLSPQAASLLAAELAKPISAADEPGYIYMFWVTPETSSRSAPPPSDIALSLVPLANRGTDIDGDDDSDYDDDSDETPEQIRRSNTAIIRARELNTLSSNPTPNNPGTVKLKIGRTNNITRRLNEWTRQCSNHLTLIRYYPYTPSSRRGNGQGVGKGLEPGKKVPHVHRVERLIHIELADIRARDLGQCPECGKEHREWFEVAAERDSLKRVDECIRRWVRWAHTQRR